MKRNKDPGNVNAGQEKKWRLVQDPVISQATIPETIFQALAHGAATGLVYWVAGFEAALLLAIVVGIALISMNIISSTVSSNVHLAEIRDMLSSINATKNDPTS